MIWFGIPFTSITGSLDPIFCSPDTPFRFEVDADCWDGGDGTPEDQPTEVECSCCTSCCHDIHGCNSDVLRYCDLESWKAEKLQHGGDGSCGTSCGCSVPEDEDSHLAILSCTDSIPTCNSDGTICFVAHDWGMVYPSTFFYDYQASRFYGFEYTKGRSDRLHFDFEGVFVNGQKCNSQWTQDCIDDTEVPVIDCRNVDDGTGLIFDGCKPYEDNDGPFGVLAMQYSYSWNGCGRFPDPDRYFQQFNP